MYRIQLSPPDVGEPEREFLLDALDNNWIGPVGPHIGAFEREVAELVGSRVGVAVSSGTAALHLALRVLGITSADHVIVPTLTFAATANAVVYTGAEPVFVDADRATWQLDPSLLESELADASRRNRLPGAVVSVDLYGQCCDYDEIVEICDAYGVPLIEDAAEALGASYRGRSAGTFGSLGIFSFNSNKILTTGGGGMLVTDEASLADAARHLANQARDPAPHYEHSTVGYNYRLSSLLAALGRGQVRDLDRKVRRRRRVNEMYKSLLEGVPGITFMPFASYGEPNAWLTCITVDPALFGRTREHVRELLARHKIEARPVWKPMHLQPVFADKRVRGGRVAAKLFERGLCLPSGSSLAGEEVEEIVHHIRSLAARV